MLWLEEHSWRRFETTRDLPADMMLSAWLANDPNACAASSPANRFIVES
jgi:hypothetical protein